MEEIREETVSLETLGCRQYMAEEKAYRLCAELAKRLEAVEEQVERAGVEIRHVMHETGRMPIEEKALHVLAQVGALLLPDQFDAIRNEAVRVAQLKAEAGGYEARYTQELKDRAKNRERELALVG